MQKILVPFMSEALGEAGLRSAFDLASIIGADLEICHMRQSAFTPIAYHMETAIAYSDQTLHRLEEANKQRAEEMKSLFERLREECIQSLSTKSGSHQVSAVWKECVGRPDLEFGRLARTSDFSLVARTGTKDDDPDRSYAESLLMTSGQPMLSVSARTPFDFDETALIAWNGSVEASRALVRSVPLLGRFKNVVVLTIGGLPENVPSPEDASRYLDTYGIASEHKLIGKGSAEKTIEDYAGSEGCGLIVMGAYSHSRLQEFVLGGVTRHLLQDTDIPLFMAH